MNTYTVAGVMSGTSLDGLDITLCHFKKEKQWTFQIIKAITYPYPQPMKEKLKSAFQLDALNFMLLHNEYGRYVGEKINEFLKETLEKPDFISSHGHTIFHQPEKQLTVQIGNGASIAATTGITTISDFRTLDLALNGQGAPLVPIGDELLFADYDYCLNLGGFANISFKKNMQRIAMDICPVNIICNKLVETIGLEMDIDGKIGKTGEINYLLFSELNGIEFYHKKHPKSLGREWLEQIFIPIIDKYPISINDKLRTIYEHITLQIQKVAIDRNAKMLITGGGAKNKFLINLLRNKMDNKIVIPDDLIIDYKEALIFGFLGVLRYIEKENCLASVTGALKNNCGGTITIAK